MFSRQSRPHVEHNSLLSDPLRSVQSLRGIVFSFGLHRGLSRDKTRDRPLPPAFPSRGAENKRVPSLGANGRYRGAALRHFSGTEKRTFAVFPPVDRSADFFTRRVYTSSAASEFYPRWINLTSYKGHRDRKFRRDSLLFVRLTTR